MLRRGLNWWTEWRVTCAALLALPFVIAAALVSAGYEPNQCAAYDRPGDVACAFLFVIVAELGWIRDFVESNDKFFVAAGTIAIASFTLALWRATTGLLTATSRSAAQQADDTRIIQRAYLAVDGYGFDPFDDLTCH